jgi:hypothetical protein
MVNWLIRNPSIGYVIRWRVSELSKNANDLTNQLLNYSTDEAKPQFRFRRISASPYLSAS